MPNAKVYNIFIIIILILFIPLQIRYTKGADWIKNWSNVPRYEVSDLVVSADDYAVYERIMSEVSSC